MVGLLIDQANIMEPQDGPKALAIEPNVIASPLTEALFSEGPEALMSKKLAVNAIHDDIFAHDEQNNTVSNRGIPFNT